MYMFIGDLEFLQWNKILIKLNSSKESLKTGRYLNFVGEKFRDGWEGWVESRNLRKAYDSILER